MTIEIKVYAACLASYNAGKLHGAWIEVTSDPDALREDIQEMLKASPESAEAEEWAFHDYDAPFDISEFMDIAHLCYLVEKIEKAGIDDEDIIKAAFGCHSDPRDALNLLDEYCGGFDGWGDFAEQYVEDTGILSEVPDCLRTYFDYDAFGRDLSLDHHGHTVNGTLHVFHAR